MFGIRERLQAIRLKHWSPYVGFIVWGSSAFTSQPTISAFIVHFVVLPLFMVILVWMAHREGRLSERRRATS